MIKKLFKNKSLRRIFLPILKYTNFDIRIRHHWTGKKLKINTYRHKGYWAHGKNREKATLKIFESLIQEGQTVVEVGGHVGYFTMFFSFLVGETGRVIVFEPGINNLPYIRKNTEQIQNITLIEKAIGNENREKVTFYMDNVTGQNNSMLEEFEGLKANMEYAMDDQSEVTKVDVELVTLDSFCQSEGGMPDVIKIDVEGFEFEVLQGGSDVLSSHPVLMVEIQRNEKEVFEFLSQYGYQLFTAGKKRVTLQLLLDAHLQNVFCLHPETHQQFIAQIFAAAS